MPRKPRFFVPGVPAHIVQRGHSREPIFFETGDYQAYLHWLKEASQRYGCDIHAFVLMANHIHLLVTPVKKDSVSQMVQYIGRHYVPYINYTYGTSGSIWEGRYKASLINDEEYLLTCMRYIELNPVRANMTRIPGAYRWTSYQVNGKGKRNSLITPHPLYLKLGKSLEDRLIAYCDLFKAHIDEAELKSIRETLQSGTPLGNEYFRSKIEAKLKQKIGQPKRGRPRKIATEDIS